MTIDLWMLFGAVVLALGQIGLQSTLLKRQAGNAWTVGPRDDPVTAAGHAGRQARALRNLLETLPLFAAAVLIAHASGRADAWTAGASAVYLVGRVAYVGAYALGTPWLRTVIWQVASAAIVVILVRIAWP